MGKTVFSDGDKSQGIKGTRVTADILNGLQNHRHDGVDADGSGPLNYAAAGGTANAITIALTPALTAHVAGMPIQFKASAANTGAATIAINALAAVAIKRPDGTALQINDLVAGMIAVIIYDGSGYQLQNALTPSGNYFHAVDEKAEGVEGGSFTADIWTIRTINTVRTAAPWASLANNRITLQAGTYRIAASAPAFAVNGHRTRLYNVTDSAITIIGTTENTSANTATDPVQTRSAVVGQFTITGAKAFELQHFADQSRNTYGLGRTTTSGAGIPEVYSVVEITKVS